MSLCHSVRDVWVPPPGHVPATTSSSLPALQLRLGTAFPSSASPHSLILLNRILRAPRSRGSLPSGSLTLSLRAWGQRPRLRASPCPGANPQSCPKAPGSTWSAFPAWLPKHRWQELLLLLEIRGGKAPKAPRAAMASLQPPWTSPRRRKSVPKAALHSGHPVQTHPASRISRPEAVPSSPAALVIPLQK